MTSQLETSEYLIYTPLVAYFLIYLLNIFRPGNEFSRNYSSKLPSMIQEGINEHIVNKQNFNNNLLILVIFLVLVGLILKNFNIIEDKFNESESETETEKFNGSIKFIPLGIAMVLSVVLVAFVSLDNINLTNLITILLLFGVAGSGGANMTDNPDVQKNSRYAAYALTALIILLATQTHSTISLIVMASVIVSLNFFN